ncbi:hypothetical protein LOK49_LG04G00673 [Camellia lanceoleosa]|uniref:Uncharacterized protein n=1 Tax=Camellia lanceoleosa TaxID=1840588 RepID=A0ACC0I1Q4_9ERIC|nr:hypothetical protein LOK49_LG04G00673 [Camellia lanceoleosa]
MYTHGDCEGAQRSVWSAKDERRRTTTENGGRRTTNHDGGDEQGSLRHVIEVLHGRGRGRGRGYGDVDHTPTS